MTPLLAAGIELMLIGMGTVFFFLTLLVAVTTIMSRLVTRYTPSAAAAVPATDAAQEIAAITAAIAEHRRRHD